MIGLIVLAYYLTSWAATHAPTAGLVLFAILTVTAARMVVERRWERSGATALALGLFTACAVIGGYGSHMPTIVVIIFLQGYLVGTFAILHRAGPH